MKVLVADDEPASRFVLSSLLEKWGYEVTVAEDGDEAWNVLSSEGSPRLVILDWMMPGRDGPSICSELRRSERPGYFYVILLTAFDRKEQLVEGMEAGADDYIPKPFVPEELRVRLRAGRRILELEAELLASREAFRFQATHDALTGLLSRRAILEALERERARARRSGGSFAVALCDVDRFKRVNDEHGHASGDAVLVEVARRTSEALRASDVIGRFGGEEFLSVLAEADGAAALAAAERIRQAVSVSPVETPAGPIRVTLSIGVATDRGDAAPTELLVSRADEALYRAKNEGRDRVRLHTPEA